MSVAPSLPHRGDRPAPASGTSTSRENRKSLLTNERRIDVLLPNLRQRLLVRPQYEGVCPTCSAWRSNGLRGLACGRRDGATVLLTGAFRAGLHRKCQACQQTKHAGSTTAGTQYGPGSSDTASSQTL
ncbi:mucin TcMUCII [Trypanosoma cruzi]|nr:mucin TcMUCII [Trypanosoma cruzi]